jgi:eukaryotic-like serine/threonine-protein kinase
MDDPAVGTLGRYRIVAELGRGAMGVVYRGEDPLLNRAVAIKTIIMSPDPEERAEYEARFYQEAKAAGGLNHPNLITIHDIGREGDTAYMAMELLDGIELRALMTQGRVPLPLALDLAAQVADGLACAHERGVIHRDIKPANVMIVRGRHAKIMDFGIARVRLSDVQTRAGAVMGSPKYMSPEQVTGLRADHRSDIFSLGIVLYELVAGTPPFAATTMTGLMHGITTATPPPPTTLEPSLPAVLDLICAKALEKDPDARYQAAAEIAADLRACLAQLTDEKSAEPAAAARVAVAAEAEVEKTAIVASPSSEIDVMLETTVADGAARTPAREPQRTRQSDVGSATLIAPAAAAKLYLSRKFDSAAAMAKLAAPDAAGAAAEPGNAVVMLLGRVWGDPERRVLAVAVAVASLGALLIALV